MGVDCKAKISGDSRVRDVAEVIAILCGGKASMVPLSGCNAQCIKIEGVTAKVESCTGAPEMVLIIIKAQDGKRIIDGETEHQCYYHFEYGESRLVSARATPFWIAVLTGVARFFGGSVDACDCDDIAADFNFDRPRKSNCEEDGEPWQAFQNEIAAVKPLTKANIKAAREYAAYKNNY